MVEIFAVLSVLMELVLLKRGLRTVGKNGTENGSAVVNWPRSRKAGQAIIVLSGVDDVRMI
jgi:hypothetical protein